VPNVQESPTKLGSNARLYALVHLPVGHLQPTQPRCQSECCDQNQRYYHETIFNQYIYIYISILINKD
jgi:hypothetical protein